MHSRPKNTGEWVVNINITCRHLTAAGFCWKPNHLSEGVTQSDTDDSPSGSSAPGECSRVSGAAEWHCKGGWSRSDPKEEPGICHEIHHAGL